MIQNYCPELMKLNKLDNSASNTVLPRTVILPPTGGETFDPFADGRSYAVELYDSFVGEQKKKFEQQQQQQQYQQQQQQQQQQQ